MANRLPSPLSIHSFLALFVLSSAYVVISSIASNPVNAILGAGLIGLGIPVFLWYRRNGGRVGNI